MFLYDREIIKQENLVTCGGKIISHSRKYLAEYHSLSEFDPELGPTFLYVKIAISKNKTCGLAYRDEKTLIICMRNGRGFLSNRRYIYPDRFNNGKWTGRTQDWRDSEKYVDDFN